MLKWISAHYHACCAVTRVRQLDRQVNRFNQITLCRLNNFNVCLDAIYRRIEQEASTGQCTKELADHLSSEIDRLESLHRSFGIQVDTLTGQMFRLSQAVELHNGAGKLLNARIDSLESEMKRISRPAYAMGPSLN